MRFHRKTVVSCAAFLLVSAAFLSLPAFADQTDDETADAVDEIVLVAHKSERSIREVAANVTVMNRSDLKSQLATSVADVFRYVPGIDYEASGYARTFLASSILAQSMHSRAYG